MAVSIAFMRRAGRFPSRARNGAEAGGLRRGPRRAAGGGGVWRLSRGTGEKIEAEPLSRPRLAKPEGFSIWFQYARPWTQVNFPAQGSRFVLGGVFCSNGSLAAGRNAASRLSRHVAMASPVGCRRERPGPSGAYENGAEPLAHSRPAKPEGFSVLIENRGRTACALPPRKNLRGGFAVWESVYQTEVDVRHPGKAKSYCADDGHLAPGRRSILASGFK